MSAEDKDKEKLPTVGLNVVLLPNAATTGRLIDLSELLGRHFPTVFTLDTETHLPHLSLYSARYPLRNQGRVEEAVRDIAGTLSGVDIRLEGYSEFSGFVFFDAVKDETIQELHEGVFSALNDLREGQVGYVQRSLRGLNPRLRANIRRGGYVFIGKDYSPHVTLGYLEDRELARKAIDTLPKEPIQFSPSVIAIAPIAPYGTCPKPLFTFPIGK